MKQKLKLVVSDFHLGRGPLLEDGSRNLLEDFSHDDSFIELLEYYSSKPYRGREVELVLNGDFINLLEGTGEELPEIITAGVARSRLESVFRGHPGLFSALAEFANREHCSISYIIGNHDNPFFFPQAKHTLQRRLEAKVQFYDFFYSFDGFLVEHGQQHDPNNWYNPGKMFLTRGLPEPILNLPWGSLFVMKILNPIKLERPYADKVRPFGRYIRWGLIYDVGFAVKTLMKILYYFVTLRFIPSRFRQYQLRSTFSILKRLTIHPNLDGAARDILRRSGYHTVIFGHTHQYRQVQFWKDKEYLNSGTWLDNVSLDIPTLGRNTVLSYVEIEYPETVSGTKGVGAGYPRPRARLKEWQGQWKIVNDLPSF